jgi:hypothetical protein
MLKRYLLLPSVFSGLLAALFIILFFIVAFLFSFQQNLWVDETTQLSGLTLSFVDVYRWLSGLMDAPFSVPSDRMPVLSYWFGMVWSQMFSADLLVMRWSSLFLVITSLSILACYFFKHKQFSVLLVSLLFLCLSPNLTVFAVEVRAYALFFLFSVLAVLLYVDILRCIEHQQAVFLPMLALSLVLSLATNTHFFGIVLAGSLLGAYLLMSLVDRRFVLNIKIILSVSVIVLCGVVFIIFPVSAAFTSQGGSAGTVTSTSMFDAIILPAVKLIYRLVAHQTMGKVAPLVPLVLIIVYGVIVVSAFKRPTIIKTTLLLALLLGAIAVFVANIFLSRFDALAPHYNLWMLPVLAVLFAHSVTDIFESKAASKFVLLSVLVVSCGYGQWTLAFSGEKYAHTRFAEIERQVNAYIADSKVTVVYNKGMAKTWFAGVYTFPASVNQYTAELFNSPTNSLSPEAWRYVHLRTGKVTTLAEIEQSSDVLVSVHGKDIYSAELNAAMPEKTLAIGHPAFLQWQPSSFVWQQIEAMSYLAQESANIVVYKKTP